MEARADGLSMQVGRPILAVGAAKAAVGRPDMLEVLGEALLAHLPAKGMLGRALLAQHLPPKEALGPALLAQRVL